MNSDPGNDPPTQETMKLPGSRKKAKPGRKPFRPTLAQTRRAEELVAGGMSELQVAVVFGISERSARTHFRAAFTDGLAKRRGEVINMLFKAARSGNVSAMKALEGITGKADVAAVWSGPRPEQVCTTPKLGKKEQQQLDAEGVVAGTDPDWGNDLDVRLRN
jgi:DNA-binding CsgD family transcriptional regulator